MSLYNTILSDVVSAMKAKDTERLAALRMIKAAFLLALKEKGPSVTELSDDEVLAVLQREAKKRKESIAAFTAGNRQDLVIHEQAELNIIAHYLPAEISEEEIEAVVKSILDQSAEKSFSVVMGLAMKNLRGKADGNRIREIVQRLTSS